MGLALFGIVGLSDGGDILLDTIAAAVIGGTSLFGERPPRA